MLSKKVPIIALVILILIFIASKWHALGLPYFWDEAWSYAPAIAKMAESPCMYPGCIDPELYRGHPMLFYFLAGTWMKLISGSLFSMHFFAVLISVLCLISFYRVAQMFLKSSWTLFSVMMLILQQVFFVQSSFVLPEVLLALLTLEGIRSFFKNQRVYFLFCLIALGLLKETGIIILFGFVLFHFFQKNERKMNGAWIYGAFVPAILFYTWQKISLGWFFYPFHQNLVDASLEALQSKAAIVIHFILAEQGRHTFLLMFGCILVIEIIKSNHSNRYLLAAGVIIIAGISFIFPVALALTALAGVYLYSAGTIHSFLMEEKQFLRLGAIITCLIFVFSILNFLMLRYLVVLFPILILVVSLVLQKLIPVRRRITSVLLMVLVMANFLYSFIHTYRQRVWLDDVSMNYINMVNVHVEVAKYAQQNINTSERIHTHFLMYHNLSDAALGYVPANYEFKHVSLTYDEKENPAVVILSGIEYSEDLHNQIKMHDQYTFTRRFEKNKAWSEIYENKEFVQEK